MARVKLVKCYARSPGGAPSVRFIPLREFNLWRYYMTHRHRKIVEGEEVSVWVDADTYGATPPRQARPLENVVRIDLEYWDGEKQRVTPVQRYFPSDDYETIRDTFVKHYPDVASPSGRPLSQKRILEVKGYFIRPYVPRPQFAVTE